MHRSGLPYNAIYSHLVISTVQRSSHYSADGCVDIRVSRLTVHKSFIKWEYHIKQSNYCEHMLMLYHNCNNYTVPTSQSEVTVIQSDDNQPRQGHDDESSPVEHTNGLYISSYMHVQFHYYILHWTLILI